MLGFARGRDTTAGDRTVRGRDLSPRGSHPSSSPLGRGQHLLLLLAALKSYTPGRFKAMYRDGTFDAQHFAPAELLGPLNEVERKFAPELLYVVGDDQLLRAGRRVSVVGSRAASLDATKRTRKLVKALVSENVTVVSGLAAGIDTVAHSAAIEFGGRTIAVLGTGVDRAYPSSNTGLHREIAKFHAAVSQFPLGSPPLRHHFPHRNKTMALISDATVIVAAGERSGTVHQAWEALRLGRDLLLLESLASRRFTWTEELLRYGAEVLSDESLKTWLDSLRERVIFDEAELVF